MKNFELPVLDPESDFLSLKCSWFFKPKADDFYTVYPVARFQAGYSYKDQMALCIIKYETGKTNLEGRSIKELTSGDNYHGRKLIKKILAHELCEIDYRHIICC